MDHSSAALRGVLLSKDLKVPGQRAVTDQQGRFELVGIVPGAKYLAVIHYTGGRIGRSSVPIFTDVTTTAGEKKISATCSSSRLTGTPQAEPPKAQRANCRRDRSPRPRAPARRQAGHRGEGAGITGLLEGAVKRGPLADTIAGAEGQFPFEFPS